jgi:hypothetical protein
VSPALKWGLIFVAGLLALLYFVLSSLGGLLAAVLSPEVDFAAALFSAIWTLLATLVVAGGATVYAGWKLFRKGVDTVRKLMDVPQQERFETAAAFQSDLDKPQPDDELTQAAERIRRLKKAAHGLVDRSLAASLERLAEVAETLLTQAGRSRAAKRKLRKQLVHHLGHVEAVILNLFRMQESGTSDPALARRAAATFERLAQDFEAQRRTAAEGRSIETEARLDLLAQEMGMRPDSVMQPPPAPPSAKAGAGLTPTIDRLFGRPQG